MKRSLRSGRSQHWLICALALLALVYTWHGQERVCASAAQARQEIDTNVAYITTEAAAIRTLGDQNQMTAAYERLARLNIFIQDKLGTVFYDRVLEVRREIPDYIPPAVSIDLGPRFTEAFWDERIAIVEKAYRNAEESLRGIAAQRTLNAQDAAWVYLGAAKAAFDSIKDVVTDLVQLDPVGIAWDLYQATNAITEQYTAIENAKLAGLETNANEAQIRLLISRTNRNLTRMKDFKSSLIVYRWEVVAFDLNLRNIANYTGHAVRDPAFPLDFSDSRYQFDPGPYLAALQAAVDEFNDSEQQSCWQMLEKTYLSIQREALAHKNAVQANIDAFGGDKTVYQNDLLTNWDYFISSAASLYDPLEEVYNSATSTYNEQLAGLHSAQSDRDGFLAGFADPTSPAPLAPATLNSFAEADENITQMSNATLFGPTDPYVAGRWYNPSFPISPEAVNFEMPEQTPDIAVFGFDDYPQALTGLADAYRNMAQAALSRGSALEFSDGDPVGYFAASPLRAGLMIDIADNLARIRSQALDFESYMDAKLVLLESAEAAHLQVNAALQSLVAHVTLYSRYLCLDPAELEDRTVLDWDDKVTPAKVSAWSYRDAVDTTIALVDAHSDYIQGQNNLNRAIDEAAGLAEDLNANSSLILLLARIIGQYQSLPSLPSQSGYESFLRNLDQLHAFYGPARIDSIMDRRDEAIALFDKIHTGIPARQVGSLTTAPRWFTADNPYCVMPEQEERIQALISAVGIWDDSFNAAVRAGFPGWEAWAREHLAADWPDTGADTVRPSVIHTSPGAGASDVSLYQTVRVSFDEAMNQQTFDKTSVVLSANGHVRTATLRYDTTRHELVIDGGRLLPDTDYSLALSEAVTDCAGNPLVAKSWSFHTQATPAEGLVHITISGVADGGAYSKPVNIDISVSSGTFTAWLARNDDTVIPVISGQRVSLKGYYRLSVTAGGLERTIDFTMSGDNDSDDGETGTAETMADANLVYMASREQLLLDQYRVQDNRFFYNIGTVVHMDDMLTGESRSLFDSGYYYNGISAVNNSEPSIYAGFLDVDDQYVLFYRNTGTEGAGVAPEDKTFRLFIYNLETKKTVEVPVAEGVSITEAKLRNGQVAWINTAAQPPIIERWGIKNDMADAQTVSILSDLEGYQTPKLFAFDGEWIIYSLDDSGTAIYQDLDPDQPGYEYSVPRGDVLMAVNADSGISRTLATGNDDHPIKVGSAAAARGMAGFVVYEMHKERQGEFMIPYSDAAWLYLTDLTSGSFITLSNQPEVRLKVEMSDSLLYFIERTSSGSYNLSATMLFVDIRGKIHDLFSHTTQPVSLDDPTLLNRLHLFGNKLVTAQNPPKAIFYGGAVSPLSITATSPANGSVDVLQDAPLTVTFSGAMNPQSFTTETVALTRTDPEGQFLERIAVTTSYDGATDTLTLTPATVLKSGSSYKVWIDGAVQDGAGNTLVKPVFWSFTTVDSQPPQLIATTPTQGSKSLAPGASLRLQFDETVVCPPASTVHLRLAGEDSDISVSVYSNNNQIIITPTVGLPFDTACSLTVDPLISDMAGNSINQPISLDFQTVAAVTPVYPQRTVFGDMNGTEEMVGSGPPALISTEAAVGTSALFYSPDGTRIYQTTSMGELYMMDLDGANRSLLDSGLPYGVTPGFTADSSRLLYSRQWPDMAGYQIVSTSLDGSDIQILHTVNEGTITKVSPSPDGKRIAYNHFIGYNLPMRLGVLELESNNLATRDGWAQPVWSVDGSRLFASSSTGTASATVEFAAFMTERISTDFSPSQRIATVASGDLYRQPAGDRIAVLSGDGVQLVDCDSGVVLNLLNAWMVNGMSLAQLVWSNDGARFWIPVMDGTGSPVIAMYDLAGGGLATIVSSFGMPYLPFALYQPPLERKPLLKAELSDLSDAATAQVRIDWSNYPAPAQVCGYQVYRAAGTATMAAAMNALALLTDLPATATSYDDTTVTPGTSYFYTVLPLITLNGEAEPLYSPFNAPISGPITPGDNDGLDDAWEYRWFGNLQQTPEGDADGDGLSNLDEWREQTDPTAQDSDGDSAGDLEELAHGFDPLYGTLAPLNLSSPHVEQLVGEKVDLVASGGSGDYLLNFQDMSMVDLSDGPIRWSRPGTTTVTLSDAVYPGLATASLCVRVVDVRFGIRPAGPSLQLQPGGLLRLSATGGSSAYVWTISDSLTVNAEAGGAELTLRPRLIAGTVTVTLKDAIQTDLVPLTVEVNIAPIPGDISGDSTTDIYDSIAALQLLSGQSPATVPNMNGDVDDDGKVGMAEVLLPLRLQAQ